MVWQAPQLLSRPVFAVQTVLFSFNGVSGAEGTGAFWSITTEWQFYLLVPAAFVVVCFLVRSSGTVRLGAVTVLTVAAGIGIRWFLWVHNGGDAGWYQFVYTPLYGNIDLFLLGFLTNWWRPRLRSIGNVLASAWPVILVATYLGYSYVAYHAEYSIKSPWVPVFGVVLPALASLPLVLVISGMEFLNAKEKVRVMHRRRTATTLYWIGALTFPVYLVHNSVLVAVQTGATRLHYFTRLALGLFLTLLIAWMLHVTVEQAVLRWRKEHSRPKAKNVSESRGSMTKDANAA